MGSSTKKKRFKYEARPAWLSQLRMTRTFLEMDGFADSSGWHRSRWASWVTRIQRGHEIEEKDIERRFEEWKQDPPNDPGFDLAEFFGDEYWQACELTNSMYAALVVTMWADIEKLLRRLVAICHRAAGKREEAFRMTLRFCRDSLSHKKTPSTLDACVRALKEVLADVPFGFDEIRKVIERETGVKLSECSEFPSVNAIRILNNSFKHNESRYVLDLERPHEQIDSDLLNGWSIIGNDGEIAYAKLPVKELAIACHGFCYDLLGKATVVLERKHLGKSHEHKTKGASGGK